MYYILVIIVRCCWASVELSSVICNFSRGGGDDIDERTQRKFCNLLLYDHCNLVTHFLHKIMLIGGM